MEFYVLSVQLFYKSETIKKTKFINYFLIIFGHLHIYGILLTKVPS